MRSLRQKLSISTGSACWFRRNCRLRPFYQVRTGHNPFKRKPFLDAGGGKEQTSNATSARPMRYRIDQCTGKVLFVGMLGSSTKVRGRARVREYESARESVGHRGTLHDCFREVGDSNSVLSCVLDYSKLPACKNCPITDPWLQDA